MAIKPIGIDHSGRRTQRRRKDGSVVGYLQLAHNRRVEGLRLARSIARLFVRLAERESGQTWHRMRTELERIKLITLTGAAGSVEQTTPLSDSQREILAALEVAPPPVLTALDPA